MHQVLCVSESGYQLGCAALYESRPPKPCRRFGRPLTSGRSITQDCPKDYPLSCAILYENRPPELPPFYPQQLTLTGEWPSKAVPRQEAEAQLPCGLLLVGITQGGPSGYPLGCAAPYRGRPPEPYQQCFGWPLAARGGHHPRLPHGLSSGLCRPLRRQTTGVLPLPRQLTLS